MDSQDHLPFPDAIIDKQLAGLGLFVKVAFCGRFFSGVTAHGLPRVLSGSIVESPMSL